MVDAVMELFDEALPLKPKREEAFREDFALHDHTGSPVALVEVKGVSKGVTREHINQADNHRERNGFSSDFPSLLIINTNMKNATSLAEKEKRRDRTGPARRKAERFGIENLRLIKPRSNAHGKSPAVREGGRTTHHLFGLAKSWPRN